MQAKNVFVKICGITNVTDALVALNCGADALGFVFAESARRVTAEGIAPVLAHLPSRVLTFGVFVDTPPDEVLAVAYSLGLGGVQLHGHEPPDEVAYLRAHLPYVIKAITSEDLQGGGLEGYRPWATLVDGPRPGSGERLDWVSLVEMSPAERLILAGGLNAHNVAEAISLVNPYGVDVSSGVESSPGHKDPTQVCAFVRAVRSAVRAGVAVLSEEEGESR